MAKGSKRLLYRSDLFEDRLLSEEILFLPSLQPFREIVQDDDF
jgi:hypothetical protein